MDAELAELSSITASLEQLARRVGEMAESLESAGEEGAAVELFGVESALDGASRRMTRLVETRRRRP